ncbi:MAG: sulfatase-like hydrolase/transferase [Candidatus Aminicenantes bacterium]|nr:sulfatase-like hydrolase/transferase [Candidatus Aminicenantes bacterium]
MKPFKILLIFLAVFALIFCQDSQSSEGFSGESSQLRSISFKRKNDYNILLITIDTWRHDRLGIHDSKYVKTPNIDRIAKKSFVFKNAFAHNPVTLPSHVNILTGTTPLYHGISDNSGFKLEDRFLSISEYLKERHFSTSAFIGAFPLDSRFGLAQGFDVYDDDYGTHNSLDFFFVERKAETVIKLAVDWISRQHRKWFSWIHLFDPHQPYLPPSPYNKIYSNDLYSGEVAYVDNCLEKLFGFLEAKKQLHNTIVIITGDHGEALGEKGEQTHAYFAYNNTLLVPLIVYIPGTRPGFIEENVCHADIFPTICDILKFQPPPHLQGESLIPVIQGHKRKNQEIYFESLTPFLNRGWAPLRGYIKENMKFIDLPVKELYDIKKDPTENNNLAGTSELKKYKSELFKLRKRLEGNFKLSRSTKIDRETRKKLESLGYISGQSSAGKIFFTEKDDLKTLLPLQNKMLGALEAFQKGMVERAIQELKTVVEDSPSFVLVYRNMATIFKNTGQINEAIKILRKGLSKNPGNMNLMSKLGIILTEAGQIEEAISLLEKCTQKEDYDPEIFNYLGVAYYKKGDFKSAIEQYRKVLELDHNYAPVYNNFGSLYLVAYQRNRDERVYGLAMENFNKALEIDPRLFSALNGRASAYYFKKDYKMAQRDWQKAIEINPGFADPYFNIGISYLKSGDKGSASGYFELCKQRLYGRLPLTEQKRLDRLIDDSRN